MTELTLYYMPTCPFCLNVLKFVEENNLSLSLKNITEKPEYNKELVDIGGKGQVPCLMIDGKALYESDDIIQWLKDNKQG